MIKAGISNQYYPYHHITPTLHAKLKEKKKKKDSDDEEEDAAEVGFIGNDVL